MNEIQTRQFDLDAARADSASRVIPATIASEHPVQRDGFLEILSCTPGAVDLSRAPLPVLEQHNSNRVNIAVAENLRIEGNKLKADIRFGSTERARELFTDAAAGIVRGLSVGYRINAHQPRGRDAVLVTSWTPHEVSVVSVPADPKSGFFRSHPMSDTTETEHLDDEVDELDLSKMTRSQKRMFHAAGKAERQRIEAIESMFRYHNINPYSTDDEGRTASQAMAEFIANGTALSGVRAWIVDNHKDRGALPRHLEASTRLTIPYFGNSSGRRNWVNYWGRDTTPEFINVHVTPTPKQAHSPVIEHFGDEQRAFEAGLWIRGQLFGDPRAAAALATRGLVSNQLPAGGVLVPDQLAGAIISLASEYGIARQYARQWPMQSGTLSIPRRASGVTGGYIAETAELPEVSMTLDAVNLVAKKYAAMIRWSTELAEDAVIDIAGLLAEEIAREFARAEDAALFNGDGTSTYGGMSGILPAIVSTAGVVTASGDTLVEVINTDLAKTMSKLPSWARQNACWFVSPEASDMLFQRIGAEAGGATMIERGGVLLTAYAGYPIVVTDSMPVQEDMSGKVMALFGRMDLGVAMGLRRDISIRVDDVSFARYDQVAMYANERFDIVCHDIGTAAAAGSLVALVGAA